MQARKGQQGGARVGEGGGTSKKSIPAWLDGGITSGGGAAA
jgi:hypothetical protein